MNTYKYYCHKCGRNEKESFIKCSDCKKNRCHKCYDMVQCYDCKKYFCECKTKIFYKNFKYYCNHCVNKSVDDSLDNTIDDSICDNCGISIIHKDNNFCQCSHYCNYCFKICTIHCKSSDNLFCLKCYDYDIDCFSCYEKLTESNINNNNYF